MEEYSQLNEKSVIRYTLALYKVAKEKSIESELIRDSNLILEKYQNETNFEKLFKSPLLNPKNQIEVVDSIFTTTEKNKIKIHKVIYAFICMLANNNRLNMMDSCLIKFKQMLASKNKDINIKVTTINAIDENTEKKLKELFSKKSSGIVNISNIIDKEILGGIIIEIGSYLIDASTRNKISKINLAIKGVNQ